jgi:hypothetical protein
MVSNNMYYPNSTSVSVSIQGLRRVMGWRDPVVCCPCDDEDEVEEEVILSDEVLRFTVLPSKPACGPKCLICLSKGDLIITTGKLWWKQTKVDPLTRNCSCRGTDAGFVHLSCITTLAETRTNNLTVPDARALEECWASCQVCKQPYQNELALSLARGFVSYADNLLSNALIDDTEVEGLANSLVRRREETLEERMNLIVRIGKNNDGIKLESYKILLCELLRKNESTSAESKEVLDKMLNLIQKMKVDEPIVSTERLLKYEEDVYILLGDMA